MKMALGARKDHMAILTTFAPPPLLQIVYANHDIKLIMNGAKTKHIGWYITHYVTKKQKASTNTSALLANIFAIEDNSEK